MPSREVPEGKKPRFVRVSRPKLLPGASREPEATTERLLEELNKEVEKHHANLYIHIRFCLWVSFPLAKRNSILIVVGNACPECLSIIQQLRRRKHKLDSEGAKDLL